MVRGGTYDPGSFSYPVATPAVTLRLPRVRILMIPEADLSSYPRRFYPYASSDVWAHRGR